MAARSIFQKFARFLTMLVVNMELSVNQEAWKGRNDVTVTLLPQVARMSFRFSQLA